MNLSILKFLPLDKILSSEKTQVMLADLLTKSVIKNMGICDTATMFKRGGKIVVIGQHENSEKPYLIPTRDFFNIGVPFDVSEIILKMAANTDIENIKISFFKNPDGLRFQIVESCEIIRDGFFHETIKTLISENATEIAASAKSEEIKDLT